MQTIDTKKCCLVTLNVSLSTGSMCSKRFSYQEQKLQRLCVAEQCQCMTGNTSLVIGWDWTYLLTYVGEDCSSFLELRSSVLRNAFRQKPVYGSPERSNRLQTLTVELQHVCCCCCLAACAAYRGNIDVTQTAAKRTEETCRPHIKYGENHVTENLSENTRTHTHHTE